MTNNTVKNDNKKQNKETASAPSPLKNKNRGKTGPKNTINFHPDIPRRTIDMTGGPKLPEHNLSINTDDNQLTVGRNISLSGEINACEKLIVEGHVEATLNDAYAIEVTPSGYFKGTAEVTDAIISGKFDGTLTVKDLLTIYKGGHIEGSVRYGRIIIESGGEITGDMAALDEIESIAKKSQLNMVRR